MYISNDINQRICDISNIYRRSCRQHVHKDTQCLCYNFIYSYLDMCRQYKLLLLILSENDSLKNEFNLY